MILAVLCGTAASAAAPGQAQRTPATVPEGSSDRPPVAILLVSFDEAGRDRQQMTYDTNAALLYELFAQRNPRDGAIYIDGVDRGGSGEPPPRRVSKEWVERRIEDAYAKVVSHVRRVHQAVPGTKVVLVLTGFGHGATAALAFVNVLELRGLDGSAAAAGESSTSDQSTPSVGALVLFDAIPFNGRAGAAVAHGYDVSVPAGVGNVLHLKARDDNPDLSLRLAGDEEPSEKHARIAEVALAGSHQDIGGGLPNPYSRIPLSVAYRYLERLGIPLKPPGPYQPPDIDDPTLRLHDPDWG